MKTLGSLCLISLLCACAGSSSQSPERVCQGSACAQELITDGGVCNGSACAPGTCVPTTCEAVGADCGTLVDGCGGILQCGSCPTGSCGGGGVANRCGTGTCTPKTCADLGADCGTSSDGCGDVLSCGSCSGGKSCGGGGVAGVCGGGACGLGCPQGYTCQSDTTCRGGDSETLVLDVLSANIVSVGGVILQNGALPQLYSQAQECATVLFENANGLDRYSMPVLCAASSQFTFSGRVVSGTYRVSVKGAPDATSLPETFQVVNPALVITTAATALQLNVVHPAPFEVSGTVRLNGQPVISGRDSSCGRLELTHAGATYSAALSCKRNETLSFRRHLLAGSYSAKVVMTSRSIAPGFPLAGSYASPSVVTVSGDRADVVIDISSPEKIVAVSGTVLERGVVPANSKELVECAHVRFERTSDTFVTEIPVGCTPLSFKFTGNLPVGTYRTFVSGEEGTTLPAWIPVHTALSVPAAANNLVLDVKRPLVSVRAPLMLDGVLVQPTASSDTAVKAWLYDGRNNTPLFLASRPGNGNMLIATIPEGTYSGSVSVIDAKAGLATDYYTYDPVTFTAATPNAPLNIHSVYKVSGSVVFNGLPPVVFRPAQICGRVQFEPLDAKGKEVNVPFGCLPTTAFLFEAQLLPGNYRVSVVGDLESSSITNAKREVIPQLTVSGNASGLKLNVVTPPVVPISGTIRFNGMTPLVYAASANCGSITFENLTGPDHRAIPFDCSLASAFNFSSRVIAGTYRVSVRANTQFVRLPDRDVVVVEKLVVP